MDIQRWLENVKRIDFQTNVHVGTEQIEKRGKDTIRSI